LQDKTLKLIIFCLLHCELLFHRACPDKFQIFGTENPMNPRLSRKVMPARASQNDRRAW